MPLVLGDEGYADVDVSMLGMVVTWRVLPVEHHTVVETSEVTELHLVGFQEISIKPVQNIDAHSNSIDPGHVCFRRMQCSTYSKANAPNGMAKLALLVRDVPLAFANAHRQHNDRAAKPTNHAGQASLGVIQVLEGFQPTPTNHMEDAMQQRQHAA